MNLHQMKKKLQKKLVAMLTMLAGKHSYLTIRANKEETTND